VLKAQRSLSRDATRRRSPPFNANCPGVIVIKSDSGSLSAAQSLGGEVKEHVDHLDGVFLNAGIAAITPFESVSPQHFDDGFNVNVRGPFFQLQSLLPLLGNPSAVVFTSSLGAYIAFLLSQFIARRRLPSAPWRNP
jgi:NAD(P)-dependent dehydrogenase (short-subunit alcohol dehydrogenase family)